MLLMITIALTISAIVLINSYVNSPTPSKDESSTNSNNTEAQPTLISKRKGVPGRRSGAGTRMRTEVEQPQAQAQPQEEDDNDINV